MSISILVGNGINRLNNEDAAWEHILGQLSVGNPTGPALEHIKHKPFALLYEEILLSRASQPAKVDDFAAKKRIASLVDTFKFNSYHKRLVAAPVRHILTTNYDYTVERAANSGHKRASLQAETKYSLFRRGIVGRKYVWHIHGEATAPNTITLGYDQYCGYLQKMRTYATAERSGESGSPFKRGERDFDEREDCVYSWLDVFFRDDIHIIGLGFDFTEIDLWWAVTYKKRLGIRGFAVGQTYFHDWYTDAPEEADLAKRSLLTGLGVKVWPVECKYGFESAYDDFLKSTLDW
jgi:SIR2-like domain